MSTMKQARDAVPGTQADRGHRSLPQPARPRRERGVPPAARPGLRGLRGQPQRHGGRGRPCYPDLASVPGGVEAVVIGTRPETAEQTVRECVGLGIGYVWMHRLYGTGSVDLAAAGYAREHGITVIAGGCPLMFDPTADMGHKLMRCFARSAPVASPVPASAGPLSRMDDAV